MLPSPPVQELGQAFLRLLKKREEFSPFFVALALSFARLHRFNDNIFTWYDGALTAIFRRVPYIYRRILIHARAVRLLRCMAASVFLVAFGVYCCTFMDPFVPPGPLNLTPARTYHTRAPVLPNPNQISFYILRRWTV